jgi:CHAD domain-containing protein
MEIEVKLAVIGPLEPGEVDAIDVEPYRLSFDGERRHHDVVLDTPSRAITSTRSALRLRYVEDRAYATFKGPNQGTNEVKERDETEVELNATTDHTFEYRSWPAEIVELIEPLVRSERLEALVEMDVSRAMWHVWRDDAYVAEVVLDQGRITAGGREAPIYEVEVELKGEGTRADLDVITDRLLERLPVRIEPRGKVQRGLALLAGAPSGGETSLDAVGRDMVRKQLKRVEKMDPAVRLGQDGEAVHDMRVATRRLRTILKVLADAPVFDARQLRARAKQVRPVARALGDLRDLEVLRDHTRAYVADEPDLAAGLEVLQAHLRARHAVARKRLLRALDRRRYRAALDWLGPFAKGRCGSGALADPERPADVRQFAGSAIWRRYEAVLDFAEVVRGTRPEALHQLRIAVKGLRYTLELFTQELGDGVKPLLDTLVRAQDHLGSLHDSVIGLAEVATLYANYPDNRGLAVYAVRLSAERDRLRWSFAPLWEDLTSLVFRRQLALTIAEL